MTGEQIIKALGYCIEQGLFSNCEECAYKSHSKCCTDDLKKDALDLINRQKAELADEIAKKNMLAECVERQDRVIEMLHAEIERLNKEVDRLSQCVLYHDGQIADAKTEAVTEFAERYAQKCIKNGIYPVLCKKALEETLKEMTEGEGIDEI